MEFGILFTSHSNIDVEPYPHRDVHARMTREIVRADELGFDYAWLAEHHFSNEYGIMPDVFVYAGYLAALTKRIKIGTAVVTLPLDWPIPCASPKIPPLSISSAAAVSCSASVQATDSTSSKDSGLISKVGATFRRRRCRCCSTS